MAEVTQEVKQEVKQEINEELIKRLIQEAVNEKEKEILKEIGSKYEKSFYVNVNKQEEKKEDIKTKLARYVLAVAAGKGNPERAAAWAKKQEFNDVVKALDTTAGEFLIPEEWSTEVIELLTPLSIFRRLGARSYPMGAAVVHFPAIIGGATAQYQGESADILPSQEEFGEKILTWKKLTSLVPISNDFIRHSPYNAQTIVSDDIMNSIALREDQAFLRDPGTTDLIKGVRYLAPTIASVNDGIKDLANLEFALKNAHVPMQSAVYIISPRTEKYFKYLTNAQGNYIFKAEMENGRLNGYPYAVSYHIPENLGDGANETEMYMVAMNEAIIGESYRLTFDVSMEATYFDGTQLVSAFSKDQTVIRAIAENDFILRHNEAAAIVTGITYGA